MKSFLFCLGLVLSTAAFAGDICNTAAGGGSEKDRKNFFASLAAPKLSEGQTTAYIDFIKKNFRLPTSAETVELGLPQVDNEYFFGSWRLESGENYSNRLTYQQNLNENVKAVFSAAQIEELIDVFYDRLKKWVETRQTFPPSFEEFAAFNNIEGKANLAAFKAIFDTKTGLFKDYNSNFYQHASSWKNLSDFFAKYLDKNMYNEEIKKELITSLNGSSAHLIAGYVSGQPIGPKTLEATTFFQKSKAKEFAGKLPLLTTPAYGLPGGIPNYMSNPSKQRFVVPETLTLSETYGNAVYINKVPLPPRALKPQTGLQQIMTPGELNILVHPQSVGVPVPSSTNKPGLIVTTGVINEQGHNLSKSAIGARISTIQNDLHFTGLLMLEKLTGNEAQQMLGLEAQWRPRPVHYNDEPVTVVINGEEVTFPEGYTDLNKHYGADGKIRDLPMVINFPDSHAPVHNREFFEAFNRQFIDPRTCLKRTDGKPADILAFYWNDYINDDFGSRHTEDNPFAQQALSRDMLEHDIILQMKQALTLGKDLQYAYQQSRGYVPHNYYLHGNHDLDRVMRKANVGTFDPYNAAFYNKLKLYKDQGSKHPLKTFMENDLGVTYNDHTHFPGLGEEIIDGNTLFNHGHKGGAFDRPLNMQTRKAARGNEVFNHTHKMEWGSNGIFNPGEATLGFAYSEGWLKSGYQALAIKTPLGTQLLMFMDGSFYGSSTHGNAVLESRDGYPKLSPLPVKANSLPTQEDGGASAIDQYIPKKKKN